MPSTPESAGEMSAPPKPVGLPSQVLATLWERGLPRLRERLSVLDTAVAATGEGSLTMEQREEACAVAHKLAGSLGMFGYHSGTDAARALEVLLDSTTPLDAGQLRGLVATLRAALNLA